MTSEDEIDLVPPPASKLLSVEDRDALSRWLLQQCPVVYQGRTWFLDTGVFEQAGETRAFLLSEPPVNPTNATVPTVEVRTVSLSEVEFYL